MIEITGRNGQPKRVEDRPHWVDFIEENGFWLVCHRCKKKEYVGEELHIIDMLKISQKHLNCKNKKAKMVRTKFPEGGG